MADLRLTFSDVYTEVSRFLGWGASPAGQNLTDAKSITHSGYNKFLYPMRLTTTPPAQHLWSFLIKDSTLTLQGGKWEYTLPADFDRLYTRFTYGTNDQFAPMKQVSSDMIRNNFVIANSEGQPSQFAIVPSLYSAEAGATNFQVLFYEIPSQAYTLHYSYVIRPPKLVNDSDYFVGGDFASETILECALAVAEIRWDGQPGTHSAEAERLIQNLIVADTPIRPGYYGRMYDSGMGYPPYDRPLSTITDPYPS
jgi:hypothetical protein